MTLKEFIQEMRNILASGFCQLHLAETIEGESIEECHPKAVRWCLLGAKLKVENSIKNNSNYYELRLVAFELILNTIKAKTNYRTIIEFNDDKSQIEVLKFLDSIILELS